MSRLLPSKRDICKHLFRQIIDIFSIDLEPKINTADGTLTPFSQKWFRLKCMVCDFPGYCRRRTRVTKATPGRKWTQAREVMTWASLTTGLGLASSKFQWSTAWSWPCARPLSTPRRYFRGVMLNNCWQPNTPATGQAASVRYHNLQKNYFKLK